MCLVQGHNAVLPVRLEPATPQSQDKHSTTAISHCVPCHLSALTNKHEQEQEWERWQEFFEKLILGLLLIVNFLVTRPI